MSLSAEGQDLLLPYPFPEEKKKSRFKSKSKVSKQPQEVVASWGRDEDGKLVSIKRFLPEATFSLNEKFLKRLSGVSRSVFALCGTLRPTFFFFLHFQLLFQECVCGEQ